MWLSRRRPLVLIASASFSAAAAVAACRAQPSCASALTHGRKFHALSYTPRRPLENLRLTPQPAAPAAASLAASPRRCPRSHSSFVSSWRSRYSPIYAIQRRFLHSTPSARRKMVSGEWTGQKVRQTFLEFFEKRGHTIGMDISPLDAPRHDSASQPLSRASAAPSWAFSRGN